MRARPGASVSCPGTRRRGDGSEPANVGTVIKELIVTAPLHISAGAPLQPGEKLHPAPPGSVVTGVHSEMPRSRSTATHTNGRNRSSGRYWYGRRDHPQPICPDPNRNKTERDLQPRAEPLLVYRESASGLVLRYAAHSPSATRARAYGSRGDEGLQALGLFLEIAPHRGRRLRERLQHDTAGLEVPGARDDAVSRNVWATSPFTAMTLLR